MADAASPASPLQQEVARLRQRVAALEAAQTAQAPRTQALQDAQELAEKVIETIRDPLLILQPDLRVQAANPAFYQLFQVHPADTLGRRIYDLGNGQWAIPELRTFLEDILPRHTVFNDFEVSHDLCAAWPPDDAAQCAARGSSPAHPARHRGHHEPQTRRDALARACRAAGHAGRGPDRRAPAGPRPPDAARSPPASTSNARRSAPSTSPCSGAWRRACRMKSAIPSAPSCCMWTCWKKNCASPRRTARRRWPKRWRRSRRSWRGWRTSCRIICRWSSVGHLVRTPQDLGAALHDWARAWQGLAAARGMTLQVEGVAALGQVAFHSNTLHRALLNLVQNALDAMEPGGTLTLAGQATATQVQLHVRDTGMGIPAAQLARIFEPLYTTKPGGTGLGFYIVHEIVAAHGGQVTVESVEGQGTTFTLTLPRARGRAGEAR